MTPIDQDLRPEVVEKLVNAAIEGMLNLQTQGVPSCSASEIMSAYFTLISRGVRTMLKLSPHSATREALRESVMTLLLECADTSTKN